MRRKMASEPARAARGPRLFGPARSWITPDAGKLAVIGWWKSVTCSISLRGRRADAAGKRLRAHSLGVTRKQVFQRARTDGAHVERARLRLVHRQRSDRGVARTRRRGSRDGEHLFWYGGTPIL